MGFWDKLSGLAKTLEDVTSDLAKKSEEYAASPIHAQQYKKQVKETFEKVVEHVRDNKDISEINIQKVKELLPEKLEYQEHINELIKNKSLGLLKKYKSYMEVEVKIFNLLSHLVVEKYGDKEINDFNLGLIDFNKVENETKLLSQELNKFEISPSINQLQKMVEQAENLFSCTNELFFSMKKFFLKSYPEINSNISLDRFDSKSF